MQPSRAPLVTVERRPVAQLVHTLRRLGDLRARATEVDALLGEVALPIAPLMPSLPWPARGYTRTLVWRDTRFELLLLAWAAGSAAPIHDHDGQDCWFMPLAGAFDLDDYAVAEADPDGDGDRASLLPLRARRVFAGELDRRDEREPIHAVAPATPLAISLHLYARPLDRCRIYDVCRGTWSWRTLRYDAVARHLGE